MQNDIKENLADRQLVSRAQQSDQGFAELVKLYHRPLRAYIASMVGDDQADDVTQETWILVNRNISGFEFRSSLKTWLYTVAGNAARSRLRQLKRRREVEVAESSPFEDRFNQREHWQQPLERWHEETPDALLGNEQLQDCLEGFMNQLKPAAKTVLTMRELQQMDLDVIANILEISQANVRVLLHRARQSVLSHIAHYQETGEC